MRLSIIVVAAFLVIWPGFARAHDGIHEQIVAVSAAIKKSPTNPALYLKRAELYRLHKEWRNSERDLNTAAKLDPKLTIVDLRRGKLWFDTGRFQRARIALERFSAAEPNAFEGALMLGRTFSKLNDPVNAAKYFARAITLGPQDAVEIYVERADVLRRFRRFEEALNGLDEGIARLGQFVTLQMPAIDLEVKLRRFDAALVRIDSLAATLPRKESLWLLKGEVLLKAKRPCAARDAFLEARKGYENRSTFQRNVRAVRDEMARLETYLNKTNSCAQ